MNETISKFGYPATLITQWQHWLLLLRPSQPTLGSCILAAKSEATAFGDLDTAAYAELAQVTAQVEAMLKAAMDYSKINYLMLMMVDPHVHFHVIPRYDGTREWEGLSFVDAGWPAVPNLGAAIPLDSDQQQRLVQKIVTKQPL